MMNTLLLRQLTEGETPPSGVPSQLRLESIEEKVRGSINKIKTGFIYMEANMPEQAIAQLYQAIALASTSELGPGWGMMLLTAAINEGALPADIQALDTGFDETLERLREEGMEMPQSTIDIIDDILDMYAKFY